MSETRVTDEFSMDCPNCGTGTILFVGGEQVPHGCDYEPPSLVVGCDDYDDEPDCSFCGGDGEQECDDYIQCCAQHHTWTHPDTGQFFQFCVCSACNGSGLAKDQVIW